MDPTSLQPVRDFVTAVMTTMASIPMPISPDVRDDVRDIWDGALLDTTPLRTAYDRLPAAHQQRFEMVFTLCIKVLTRQADNAQLAVFSRIQMAADALDTTGLPLEDLLPFLTPAESATADAGRPHLALVTDDFVGHQAAVDQQLEALMQLGLQERIEAAISPPHVQDNAEQGPQHHAERPPATSPPPDPPRPTHRYRAVPRAWR